MQDFRNCRDDCMYHSIYRIRESDVLDLEKYFAPYVSIFSVVPQNLWVACDWPVWLNFSCHKNHKRVVESALKGSEYISSTDTFEIC